MFWKRTALPKNLESWEILQWWRKPQEYVPWLTINIQEPLKNFVSEKNAVLVEFDDEVSLLSSESELSSVLEELWKKAKKQVSDVSKSAQSQLLLKSSEIGTGKFLVKPFVELFDSRLPFWPPKDFSVDLSLILHFLEQEASQFELEKRFLHWTQSLQSDQIDRFVYQQSLRLFEVLLQDQAKKSHFDALIDILNSFDATVLTADDQVSQDYLKKVWQIPLFIFANQPEQAALTRLLLQKSFEAQRSELTRDFTQLYLTQLLNWQLFKEFDQSEQKLVEPLIRSGKNQSEFVRTELFRFYKALLSRCGVPIELGELYGTDVYLARVLAIFSQFPKADELESALSQTELYSILLEETVKFAMRHNQDVTGQPKELLRTLIRVMIGRFTEFREKKKETEKALV